MKIRTNYTFNSNSLSLFSCFSNVLDCCKCTRWDFTAQIFWWYCAFAHLFRRSMMIHLQKTKNTSEQQNQFAPRGAPKYAWVHH